MRRGGARPIDRAVLWAYLGHPDDEPPARRRILYGILALRLGLGLCFAARGWVAIFAAPGDALASRLGDVGQLGLTGALAADTVLFLLGCTELAAGVLLLAGAFSRVSAVTGSILLLLYLARGAREPFVVAAMLASLGGLLVVVLCGSPFMSADRFLDKVEEEERDRAPAVLPAIGTLTPLFPRLGLAAGMLVVAIELWRRDDRAGVGAFAGAALALALALGLGTRWTGPLGAAWLTVLAALSFGRDAAWLLAIGGVGTSLLLTGGGTITLGAARRPGQSVTQRRGPGRRRIRPVQGPSGEASAESNGGDQDGRERPNRDSGHAASAAETNEPGEAARLLYRIVRSDPPTRADFLSNEAKDLPPRGPELRLSERHAGVTMFDTEVEARTVARRYPNIGRYLAAIRIPVGSGIVVRQTLRPGHYTVWGTPDDLLTLVVGTMPV